MTDRPLTQVWKAQSQKNSSRLHPWCRLLEQLRKLSCKGHLLRDCNYLWFDNMIWFSNEIHSDIWYWHIINSSTDSLSDTRESIVDGKSDVCIKIHGLPKKYNFLDIVDIPERVDKTISGIWNCWYIRLTIYWIVRN